MPIKNGDILYRYADPKVFPEGQSLLPISVFCDNEMSCDWATKQASPEKSPHITNGRNMIISISICDAVRNPTNPKGRGEVVEAWKQDIVYDPLVAIAGDPFTPNDSHSLIKGRKKGAVTAAIRDNSTYAIV